MDYPIILKQLISKEIPALLFRGRWPKYLQMAYDVCLKIASVLANFSDPDDASYCTTSGFSLFGKVPIYQHPE